MPGVRIDFEGHFAQFNDSLDQVKRKVARTGDDITKAFSSIRSGVLGSAAALAGLSVGAVFGGMIRGASEAEQASLRLTNALKVTGSAAGVTKEEIDDLADAMARSTEFDDESIRKAAAELLVFRNVQGQVFKDTLALSADVAAALGTNIPEAAARLGRSLEDPDTAFGLLRRQGIILSEQQKDTIKRMGELGDKAGQQRIILEQLQKAFGGLAETLNTGVNKSTNDVRKAWDELLEALGRSSAAQSVTKSFLDSVASGLTGIKETFESGTWWERAVKFFSSGFGVGGTAAALIFGGDRAGRPRGTTLDRDEAELGAAMGANRQRLEQEEEARYIRERDRLKKLKEEREAAAKAAIKEAQDVAKAFEKLKRETFADALGLKFVTPKTREEFDKIKEVMEGAKRSMFASAEAALEGDEAQTRAAASGESWIQKMEKVRESMLSAIDPLHAYRKELEGLENALKTGFISQEQFNEAVRNNQLRRSIVDQGDPIAKFREQFELIKKLEALGPERGGLSADEATDAINRIQQSVMGVKEQLADANSEVKDFTHAISTAFEKAVIGGEKAVDVLRAFGQTLLQIATRMLVTKPLESSLEGLLSGASSGISGFLSNLFAPRASGGPVWSGGAFLVGEKGPELFVPSTSGSIVSNANLADAGSGPTFNIDARGADVAAVARLESMVRDLNGTFNERAVNAVVSATTRGGAAGMAIRGA